MGDLREELRKAGLLSDKDARRIAHEERVKKSREGRDIKEREAQERRRAQRRQQHEKRASDQRRDKEKQARLQTRQERSRIRDLVRESLIREGIRGPRRFHFVTRDGSVPFLQVDVALARRLEAGEVGIVELAGGKDPFGVVPAAVAAQLGEVDTEAVRFLVRR